MKRFFVAIVLCLALPALVFAQVEPRDLVEQVDVEIYTHYLADLLYTHDGDNRGINGPEHDLARDNIEATFTSFGLDTYLHPFEYRGITYYNVVAVHEGAVTPDIHYIVGGHYDSANTPGADDNGSGTAGTMEIARIMSQYEFESTLIFIGFDREEQGLWGSRAYASEHRNDDIRGMISTDMIAWNGHTWIVDIYGREQSNSIKFALRDAVAEYSNGLRAEVKGGSDNSDHAPFEWEGKPACLIIEDWGNPCYHRACDSVDTPNYIDYDYGVQIVRSVVGCLAEQAKLITEDTRCKDLKKFTARCKSNGKIKAKVRMRNKSHNGEKITFAIDDAQRFEVTINGRKAKMRTCCYQGPHTVSVGDPEGCVDPIQVGCP